MSEKSAQKKEYIVQTARKVFVEKGYKDVTMKDIVEACDISRGGLYLYFENTKDIFLAVLQQESEETDDVFAQKVSAKSTPADIFAFFLMEQKKELLRKKGSLSVAVYEYFFQNKVTRKENYLGKQFQSAVKIMEKLIEAGVQSGEFICEDAPGTARNIMYVIEGLKISAQTIGITESMVDSEFVYILHGLGVEE